MYFLHLIGVENIIWDTIVIEDTEDEEADEEEDDIEILEINLRVIRETPPPREGNILSIFSFLSVQ